MVRAVEATLPRADQRRGERVRMVRVTLTRAVVTTATTTDRPLHRPGDKSTISRPMNLLTPSSLAGSLANNLRPGKLMPVCPADA